MGSKKNITHSIACPLTLSKNVHQVDTFDVGKIVNLYKQQINIDVSRYFKGIEEVLLLKCNDTGYLFYWPLAVIGDEKFYEELSLTRTNYYSERWEHVKTLKFLSKKNEILEIGSGFGAFIKLLQHNEIFKVKGLELNSIAVDNCKIDNLNVEERLIEDELISKPEFYDVVCCFQVLEHISNVRQFLDDSLGTLKKGGRLIIGVPNNNPYLFVSDKWHTLNLPPHHAGLWSKESLKSLEKLFTIKLEKLEYEPLAHSYSYFLDVQLKNGSVLKKVLLKISNKLFPNLTKKLICYFINGRNVLAVFVKD